MATKWQSKLPLQMVAGVLAIIILIIIAVFSSLSHTAKFSEAAKMQKPPATCGNLVCEKGETQQNCGIDCLPVAHVAQETPSS